MVRIVQAHFLTSAATPEQAPDHGLVEIGMLGRSNVGKSSLINALCNQRHLAKTSSTPGKTRLINFFEIEIREPDGRFCIVDLPGYGYAKAGRAAQAEWNAGADRYVGQSERLHVLVQLLDCRHDPTEQDLQLREWLKVTERTRLTVLTKADKLSKQKLQKSERRIRQVVDAERDELFVACSASKKRGMDRILLAMTRAAGLMEET